MYNNGRSQDESTNGRMYSDLSFWINVFDISDKKVDLF